MRTRYAILLACVLAPSLACGPKNAPPSTAPTVASPKSDPEAPHPLLGEWTGPFGGVPAFDTVDIAQLQPAMAQGIELHLAELDAIAANEAPPTFENTIVAMDRAGAPFDRAETYYDVWSSNMSSPEFRQIQEAVEPMLSEYRSKIIQNEALFARVKAVYEGEEVKSLTPAQQRLVRLVYERFAREGAALQGEAKVRYAEIQKRLAELHTTFGNNVLADEEGYVTYLTEAQLGGLPDAFVKAAAAAAKDRGKEGSYAITNTRSSMDPFLTYSTERDLREKVWRNYYSRGDNGDAHDNNAVIKEILKLRHERVKLLGYPDYATWRLEDRMAKDPKQAMALMDAVWPAATKRAREEIKDMQKLARKEGAKFEIEAWDYRYYADKVRKAKYALDSNEVKQYLQLDKLREAMFMVAGELFGFAFTPVTDGSVPVFHPDVKVWKVTNENGGKLVGLWYLDPYARPGKRSGAWATSYRGHSTTDGETTVLSSNNSNFIKGAPGEPVLVSWDDATTFFHEFGHALHALSSNVDYRTLNGGVRDYTEFQSQLLERWLSTDEVINGYLLHHETGEPMPPQLVAKIKKAANFNQGFGTTEYLASAIIDLELHMTDPATIDPDTFETERLAARGLPKQIVMRHRTPHFGHVFSGEGYAAGYYGYLWADVLTADAGEAFAAAAGGFYDDALAGKLVQHLFAPRNAVDPAEAYRAFRGRDATIDALMRDRGFAPNKAAKPAKPAK